MSSPLKKGTMNSDFATILEVKGYLSSARLERSLPLPESLVAENTLDKIKGTPEPIPLDKALYLFDRYISFLFLNKILVQGYQVMSEVISHFSLEK